MGLTRQLTKHGESKHGKLSMIILIKKASNLEQSCKSGSGKQELSNQRVCTAKSPSLSFLFLVVLLAVVLVAFVASDKH